MEKEQFFASKLSEDETKARQTVEDKGGFEFANRMRSQEQKMFSGVISKINKLPKSLKGAVMGLSLGTIFSSAEMALPQSAEAGNWVFGNYQGVHEILRGFGNQAIEAKKQAINNEYYQAQGMINQKFYQKQTEINQALYSRQQEINEEKYSRQQEIRDSGLDQRSQQAKLRELEAWSRMEHQKIQTWARQAHSEAAAEHQRELNRAQAEWRYKLWMLESIQGVVR